MFNLKGATKMFKYIKNKWIKLKCEAVAFLMKKMNY